MDELTIRKLFALLDKRAPDLKPPCRWLLLGADLATILIPKYSRPPEVEDLTHLMRLLKKEAPGLLSMGQWMVAASEESAATQVELQLDILLDAPSDSWSHPIQILDRPRADFPTMLRACKLRLMSAQGLRRERLQEVQEKLERAVRIAQSAELRRLEMQRKRERKKGPGRPRSEDS